MDYLNSFYTIYPEFLHQVYNFLNSFANNQFGYFFIYLNTTFNLIGIVFGLIKFITSLSRASRFRSNSSKGNSSKSDKTYKQKKSEDDKQNDNK